MARITPIVATASAIAAMITARGGPLGSGPVSASSPRDLPSWRDRPRGQGQTYRRSGTDVASPVPHAGGTRRRRWRARRESGESPTLQQLGEFAVIDRLVRGRRQPAAVALGPGDDAAVVSVGDGRTVVSTDMLVQDRHFRLDWSTPHDVGRKAIAQNAADIEAMGARATAFVVGFGAPGDTPAAQVDALVDGMWDEAGRIGAGIVGGDLVSCPQWVLSVTVLGDLDGRAPVLRSGAKAGSAIAVAGELGRSAAGYALWHNA